MAPSMKRVFEWLGLTDSADEFDPDYEESFSHHETVERETDTQMRNSNVQVFAEPSERRPVSRFGRSESTRSNSDSRNFERKLADSEERSSRLGFSEFSERQNQDLPKQFSPIPSIKPIQNQTKPTVHILYPKRFKDATEVADLMRDGLPVILNLQNADLGLPRRLIDFCSGVTYALEGKMEKVAESVFLLSPSNVTVSQEERANLSERGVF